MTAQLTISPDNSKKPSYSFVCGGDAKFGPGCGRSLTLDERFKNKDGTKKVPLEYSYDNVGQIHLEPHKCPVKEQARKEQSQKMLEEIQSMRTDITELKYEISQLRETIKGFFTPHPLSGE